MVTKTKSARGRPKKSDTKPKSETELFQDEGLPSEEPSADNTETFTEQESSVSESELTARVAHLEMLLAKQADDITVMATERDELKAKVTSLTLKLSLLLRDKEQLQLELNAARKK